MGLVGEALTAAGSADVILTSTVIDGHFHVRVGKGDGDETKPTQTDEGNTLVTGGDDPLFRHLVGHIDRATSVDLAVAFALESGVALLFPYLRDLLARGGSLRLVVGDYMDVTEPVALRRLMDLEGLVDPYIFETRGGSFHPKAWLFRSTDNDGVAIVGSSNLTQTALTNGVEWNLQTGTLPQDWLPVLEAFETLLAHPSVAKLSYAWIDRYAQRRTSRPLPEFARAVVDESPPEPPPEPHEIQVTALEALARTREHGNRAGLVILATGLGKTWLAAFDSVPFGRVLFVAHREEILSQAMATFRQIRPEAQFGRYTGTAKEEGDIVFASIQTIGRSHHLSKFKRDEFDYIVVDEFHHAAAASYRLLLEHFTPQFLLGLTATPERTDGGDLLSLCGENLVFRCDLFEGVNSGKLVPFHYFGVPDSVDYQQIPWRSSRFDEEALTLALATKVRAQNALDQFNKHRQGSAIGFCCSVRHANFMSDFFAENGIRSASVHSGEGASPRTSSLEALARGEIDILFAVDMFNEGVDVPTLDTVLMLRPTESEILFLQQLGRGLRTAPRKTHLQVIDYIGNHRSFLTKVRALLAAGEGDGSISHKLQELEKGELALPDGCEVTYELEAMDMLKAMLRTRSGQNEAEAYYRDFRLRYDTRPTASQMAHADFDPTKTGHGGWFTFVSDMGDDVSPEALTTHGDLFRMVEMGGADADAFAVLSAAGKRLETGIGRGPLFAATRTFAERRRGMAQLNEERFEAAVRHWLTTPYFVEEGGMIRLSRTDPSGKAVEMLTELVDWRLAKLLSSGGSEVINQQTDENPAVWSSVPELWQSYMREEIPPLFGKVYNSGSWNNGIVRVGRDLILLVTLKKGSLSSGDHYKNRFVNADEMQWQSQKQTTMSSSHGLVLSGQDSGARVFLFVRSGKMRNLKAAPFIYCGQPKFKNWQGEKPITITWELEQEVPQHLRQMLDVPG